VNGTAKKKKRERERFRRVQMTKNLLKIILTKNTAVIFNPPCSHVLKGVWFGSVWLVNRPTQSVFKEASFEVSVNRLLKKIFKPMKEK
jgi:hypothetical protein